MPKSRFAQGVRRSRTQVDDPARAAPRRAGTVEREHVRELTDAMIHGIRERYGECDFGIWSPSVAFLT